MFGAELNLIPSRPNDKNGSTYPSQGRQFGLGGWLTVHTSRPAVLSPGTVHKTNSLLLQGETIFTATMATLRG